MSIPLPLQEALRDSITSGTFVDTKFWLFSKRGPKPGRVGEPKALFVNGRVAKRIPRLASLLAERAAKENLRARFPANRKPYTSHYDYEDDSDLEEDYDDDDISDDEPASVPQIFKEKPGDNDAVVLEKLDTKSSEPSDILSVSDLESLFSESSDTKGGTETTSSAHIGKVAVIEDVAFVTFQALLRYLYTNEIEFAPWGSAERRKARALEKISESYGIPRPSPKSIYRLADKYDIPELKELALRHIQRDLSQCSITEEVFSKYTSWYPELRELELRQLGRVLLSAEPGPTMGLLRAKIKGYAHGEFPHAENILPALYEFMESDESVKETPVPAVISPDKQATDGDWEGLKRALTTSLTSGTFLDCQFYAVESRLLTSLPKIRPVYFCSAVGGGFTSELTACSSKLRARGAPPPRCADGYDSDVDDEDPDPEGSAECYPCSKLVRENPTAVDLPIEPALLLKSGAAKTWSAIFLYMYTGQITFANLGSQDVTPSENEVQDGCSQGERLSPQESEGLGVPPPGTVVVEPCSPKSVYRLADKVGLIRLCDLALEDIRSKLDESNIVHELFSPSTASNKRVREMEHELFQSELKPSVDGALISSMIRSSSSGLHSHRAVAMELIMERSIQDRRGRVLAEAKNRLRPDPTPQPKSGAPDAPTSQVQSSTPATALQPPPRSLLNDTTGIVTSLASASDSRGASQVSSAPSKSTKKVEGEHEEPPADVKMDPSPPEVFVELKCRKCGVKQLRSSLYHGINCSLCPKKWRMRCVGCGTRRVDDIDACTGCHGKFK